MSNRSSRFQKGPKQKLTFEQKLEKEDSEFTDSVRGLDIPQLEARIAKYQKELQDSEEHKAQNAPLKEAQANVKELSGGYSDCRKDVKKKTRYLISMIRSKGGA